MTPLFRRFKTLLLLTCVIGCRQIAIAQNTPTPAFDAAGVAVFKKNIGPEEFHRLQGRLMELNHDIVTRGILPFNGSSDKLLTGYAYHEFYDWDLYFENLYLSYYGLATIASITSRLSWLVQHPDGFIPPDAQTPEHPDVQAVPGANRHPRLEAAEVTITNGCAPLTTIS